MDDFAGLSEKRLCILHGEGMRRFEEAWTQGKAPEPVTGLSLLDIKHEIALRLLESYRLCERRCGVGTQSRLASEFLHLGEEPELIPSHTLFFCGCTFRAPIARIGISPWIRVPACRRTLRNWPLASLPGVRRAPAMRISWAVIRILTCVPSWISSAGSGRTVLTYP